MKQYHITGMSCAACQARIEQVVSKIQGVKSCSVSLLTNSMSVDGDVADDIVINAVIDAGYGAKLLGDNNKIDKNENILVDNETPVLKKRLLTSIIFLLVLMYFSMGHMMFKLPLPSFFVGNYVAIGITQMLLAIIIMLINKKFFISGFKSAAHGAPNMDTLVALGSSVSFGWSVYALYMLSYVQVHSGIDAAKIWMNEFYFESAAMILTLITIGKTLEAYSKGKTTDALKSLIKLAPKTATVIKNDKEIIVDIDEVKIDDVFVVRSGDSIPVDGIIIDGNATVNESALTGEFIPVDKINGDKVFAATINQTGYIKCIATKVGDGTTFSQIIKLVREAQTTKAPIAKVADKVSSIFVPTVIIIAIITFVVWMFLGKNVDFALARAISVLVISCPCSLGLATPVAIMVGSGVGAKHGILFKNAISLEEAGKVKVVVFDKTGTITRGEPRVVEIIPEEGINENDLLIYAYSLEIKSEHPLAYAIVMEAQKRNIQAKDVIDFKVLSGNGLMAKIGNETLIGGSMKFVGDTIKFTENTFKKVEMLANDGLTPLFFAKGDKFLGIIVVADTIKSDGQETIDDLQSMGINVVMLTGDNNKTAKSIGKKINIENVIAGVLPNEKENVISELKKFGKVAMVGDGINDAPALTSADIGIAIGQGTDVAIDAADIVLMNNKLKDVVAAIRLSKATLKNIYENLFWAFFYNSIGIPLAAGCFIKLFGWQLSPMFGAAAMSLSSFCVVTNALRLNLFDIYAKNNKYGKSLISKNDKAFNDKLSILIDKINEKKERKIMTKKIIIEGMMCGHCEAHVKKALESIDGVESAVASHVDGNAIVTLSKEVDNNLLKSVVEKEDYKVISIE